MNVLGAWNRTTIIQQGPQPEQQKQTRASARGKEKGLEYKKTSSKIKCRKSETLCLGELKFAKRKPNKRKKNEWK